MKENKMKYTVGKLASHFGVSRDTIRLYDKMGILHPAEIAENGYRVYSREDFICLDYIMRLRRLNMSLKEINELVNSSSIEEAEAVMEVQATMLEEKISELKSLQIMVEDYQKSFRNVIHKLGKITVETSPTIISRPVGESMVVAMERFNQLTKDYTPKFTFTTTKEKYTDLAMWADFTSSKTRQNFYDYTITLLDDDGFADRMDLEKKGFTVLRPHKSIHAILKAYTNTDYSEFIRCRDYILDNGYQLVGNPMFRVVSIRSYDVAYYDFWAPIQ